MSSQPILTVDATTLGDRTRLAAHLSRHGLALFQDQSPLAIERAFRSVARVQIHRDSEESGATRLRYRPEEAGNPGFDGFTRKPMPPHTDGSAMPRPAELICNVCVAEAESGGGALLVDGCAVVSELLYQEPVALTRLLSVPVPFGLGMREFPVINRLGSSLYLRYREDGLALFDSISAEIHSLRAAMDRHLFEVDLRPGSGYILQNGRWLHGRAGFSGGREVLRFIGRARRLRGLPLVPFGFRLPQVTDAQLDLRKQPTVPD